MFHFSVGRNDKLYSRNAHENFNGLSGHHTEMGSSTHTHPSSSSRREFSVGSDYLGLKKILRDLLAFSPLFLEPELLSVL